ncbi:CLUMA_CG009706, isoform A [Clunio marinus]|uniref:CLUMA_CG009706, isoform A n=1 Tax=Clunio marinus TaxID=568069 RepID=A0A1J1I9N4_9DIPT|nr:CLUMA_CG009706, isoform A [Clunio marinus]
MMNLKTFGRDMHFKHQALNKITIHKTKAHEIIFCYQNSQRAFSLVTSFVCFSVPCMPNPT